MLKRLCLLSILVFQVSDIHAVELAEYNAMELIDRESVTVGELIKMYDDAGDVEMVNNLEGFPVHLSLTDMDAMKLRLLTKYLRKVLAGDDESK